jgi:hypothetical protein
VFAGSLPSPGDLEMGGVLEEQWQVWYLATAIGVSRQRFCKSDSVQNYW